MEGTVCPKCGNPGAQGRFCARCGAPLEAGQAEAAPGGALSATTPAQEAAPAAGTAQPAAPPAAAYPPQPGYGAQAGTALPYAQGAPSGIPPSRGGGGGKAVLFGVLGLLLVAGALVLLLGFAVGPKWFVSEKKDNAASTEEAGTGGKDARGDKDSTKGGGGKGKPVTGIVVPIPPGWQEGSGAMGGDMMLDMLEQEMEGMASVDAFYADSSMSNMIIAMNMDVTDAEDIPPDDVTLSEMEEFIKDNRLELLEDFASGMLSSGAVGADVYDIHAFQTKSGDVGAEITLNMGPSIGMGAGADVLVFFKGDRVYMVMLMSMGQSVPVDVVKFLKDNITFK